MNKNNIIEKIQTIKNNNIDNELYEEIDKILTHPKGPFFDWDWGYTNWTWDDDGVIIFEGDLTIKRIEKKELINIIQNLT